MATQTFTLDKSSVYAKVHRASAYAGQKLSEGGNDETAFDRIRTTEGDEAEFATFWDQAEAELTRALKNIEKTIATSNGGFTLSLDLSSSWDSGQKPGMEKALEAYFVSCLTAKWYAYANKTESQAMAQKATAQLEEFKQGCYARKRPSRPTYL